MYKILLGNIKVLRALCHDEVTISRYLNSPYVLEGMSRGITWYNFVKVILSLLPEEDKVKKFKLKILPQNAHKQTGMLPVSVEVTEEELRDILICPDDDLWAKMLDTGTMLRGSVLYTWETLDAN